MKLQITSETCIYVVCPPYLSSGGPELLHQLVCKLNRLGHKAFIYYYPADYVDPVHPQLREYNNPYVDAVKDVESNILLVPEISTEVLEDYQFVQKVIWWLSVDFHYDAQFKKTLKGRIITRLNKWFRNLIDSEASRALFARQYQLPQLYYGYLHLVQSRYAYQHLLKKKVSITSVEYLSDYLNSTFVTHARSLMKRNLVLYNPKKGFRFTKRLIAEAPDIEWVPITNMSRAEVADLMGTSKVYIDFGCHPGKDRIPREAAVSGCCVIVAQTGSAAFFEDVPIPEKYKYRNSLDQVPAILSIIRDCLARYEVHLPQFDGYREKIRVEEGRFDTDLLHIFCKTDDINI
jgi:hypothetical protein